MGSDWLQHVKSNTNQIVLIDLHIETINGIVSPHVYMFLYNKVNHSHILIGSYLWSACFYNIMISWIIHTSWLALTYDLLKTS